VNPLTVEYRKVEALIPCARNPRTKIADSVICTMRHKDEIGQDIDHLAVFPLALPQFVLEAYSDTDDIVFEPFCGSGTTMLDARRAGRQCRLVDIAPQYVDVAVKRFQQNFPDMAVTLLATGQSFKDVRGDTWAHVQSAQRELAKSRCRQNMLEAPRRANAQRALYAQH
jgi:hypothetical protein